MTITSLAQLDLKQRYSYADYLTWQFSERIELLKGYIRQMAAPSTKHQRVAFRLERILGNHFDGKTCEVFHAPFDVRLDNRKKSLLQEKEVFTVVQPDICIVCDETKIDTRGCNGAPELIIEILSPNNSATDIKDKYELYAEAGVTEYWIVYPQEEHIQQYVLVNENYQLHEVVQRNEKIIPYLFPDLVIDLEKIFVNT
jgi:Uma2 family endonuclease